MIKKVYIGFLRFLFDFSSNLIGPNIENSVDIKEITIFESLNLRVYKPSSNIDQIKPIFIYYHGGGWTLGSLNAYDKILQYLCYNSNHIVVAVDYRKAPEHKFPAASDDALSAYDWVIKHMNQLNGDIENITIGGDSAGGNLTHITLDTIMKTQRKAPKKQILIYPVLDITKEGLSKIKDYKINIISDIGYKMLNSFLNQYLDEEYDPLAVSPSFKDIDLGTIKTLIITAEYDPLTATSEEYIYHLKEKNNYIVHHHFPQALHGFIQFSGVSDISKKALDYVVDFLT